MDSSWYMQDVSAGFSNTMLTSFSIHLGKSVFVLFLPHCVPYNTFAGMPVVSFTRRYSPKVSSAALS